MATFFDPGEDDALERQAQQMRRRRLMTTPSAAQAANVAEMARVFPFLQPGVALSLGLAGVPADSPVAQAAAKTSVRMKSENKGLGWHSIGEAVSGAYGAAKAAGSAVTPDFVGDSLGSTYEAAKTVTRGAFIGLESIGQAVQGEFRNNLADDGQIDAGEVLGVLDPRNLDFEQTNLGVSWEMLKKNGLADTVRRSRELYGDGFFVNGEIRAEQRRRAVESTPAEIRARFDGKAPSIGRWAAASVDLEPGGKAYNILSGLVDGSLLLATDPSVYFGGGVARTLGAKNSLVDEPLRLVNRNLDRAGLRRKPERVVLDAEAGLVDGTRQTVLSERASSWLTSSRGRAVLDDIAADSSYYSLRRKYGKKLGSDLLVKLADARSADEVFASLAPELGITIRSAPSAPSSFSLATARVSNRKDDVRLLQQMPGPHLDVTSADDATTQLDLMLRNVKGDRAFRAERVEAMARATNKNERFKVLADTVADSRFLGDVEPAKRRQLGKLFKDYDADFAKYFVDEIGENATVPGVVIDAAGKALPTPHLFGEYVNRLVPLPDARELRRATSRYRNILDNPAINAGTAAMDYVSGKVFKPLALARVAYPIRVIGEEQLRMAASGQQSMIAHPLSYLAWVTGRKGDSDLLGKTFDRASDLTDDLSAFGEAMAKGSNGFLNGPTADPTMLRTRYKTLVERTSPAYPQAWAEELQQLATDPIARRVVNGLGDGDVSPNGLVGLDGVKDWFFNGAGQKLRLDMADAPGRDLLVTRSGADAYVDSVLARVKIKTGDDLELWDAVGTGKWNGYDLGDDFVEALAAKAASGQGPAKVKGDLLVHVRDQGSLARFEKWADKSTEGMFNILMSRPTNYLSRSPAFKQFYYRRATELLSQMSAEAQAVALRRAEKAGLSGKQLKQMREYAALGTGKLTVEESDVLAKGFALDSTRELLYDLHKRSQFFDVARIIFPFGEAWKEVLTTWARIGSQNPVAIRRGFAAVQGARSGDINGDGRGFFYANERGEEVFAYPGTGWLTEQTLGVRAPFTGTGKGLNVFSQTLMPGVGPVVQIAAGKLLPDDPDLDPVKKFLLPFGETDTSGGYIETFLPTWYKKFQTSGWAPWPPRNGVQERAYSNTVMDVVRYLVSTGDYSIGTPEESDRTLEAAKKRASGLYLIRGLAQVFAPSPPSPEQLAQTKDGNLRTTALLADEYRKLQQEDYRTATERFIDRFGEGAFLSTIGKTEGGGPVTKEGFDLVRRNPEVGRLFGDVVQYFVPDGDFDSDAYRATINDGTREQRKPEDAIALANQRIGAMIYRAAQDKVGENPSPGEREYLRGIKTEIKARYPGYAATPSNLRKTEDLIDNLLTAARNPVLAKTDAGKGLTLYLEARQKAVAAANDLGLETFGRSPKAAGIRTYLRGVASAIETEHPEFGRLFDEALEREMVDDEERAA